MTTDPIKALVGLEAELVLELKHINQYSPPFKKGDGPQIDRKTLQTILAAIEALKPMADVVMVPSTLLKDIRAIADTGGRRIETAMDACDKIIELIDMERQLGPATSPAPSDEGVVERVAKAIYAAKGYCYTDDDRMFQAYPWDDHDEIIKEGFRTEARAALAAIKEGE